MQIVMMHLTTKDGHWTVRVDSPHNSPPFKKHVHIKRKGLKGEYSWNIDGTRHDKGKFPKREEMIEGAKAVAAKALGVSSSTLQLISELPAIRGELVLISVFEGEGDDPTLMSGFSMVNQAASGAVFLSEEKDVLIIAYDIEDGQSALE